MSGITKVEVDRLVRTKERLSHGSCFYKAGSAFVLKALYERSDENGKVEIVLCHGHPFGYDGLLWNIRIEQVEDLHIIPSPIFNLAVEHGYKGCPDYFENGRNAHLERRYAEIGGLSLSDDMDYLMNSYVGWDDAAKKGDNTAARMAELYRQRCVFLEQLQDTIKKYHAEQGL